MLRAAVRGSIVLVLAALGAAVVPIGSAGADFRGYSVEFLGSSGTLSRYRLYAQFDGATNTVRSAYHFHVLSGSPVFFHSDSASGGSSSSSSGSWSPAIVTNEAAFDSWVAIGSVTGASSTTVSGSGWGAAGFAQAQIPSGASIGAGPTWTNASPSNLQGRVGLNQRVLLGQFVVPTGAAPFTASLKLAFDDGPGTVMRYAVDTWSLPATGEAAGWGLVGYSQMSSLANASMLAAGGISSMLLRSDGSIGAWGYNGSGQCTVPAGLGAATAIRMGDGHSVALVGGGVFCWGRNDFGQTSVPGSLGTVTRIGAGGNHTLALTAAGTVVAWGANQFAQSAVPATVGTATEVAGGGFHSMAIRANGTVACWGRNDTAQCNVPATLGTVTAIAAGGQHSAAIRTNGTVVCWGLNLSGQTSVPTTLGTATRIAAGFNHTVALTSAGAVVAWGANAAGQSTVPSSAGTSVVGIAAGGNHALALKSDGSIVGWGDNSYSQTTPPAALGRPIAVTGGYLHAVAIRSDGTVAAWGTNTEGQTNVPATLGPVLEVAAGERFNLARRLDGTVVAWGENVYLQSNVPPSLGQTRRIAAGRSHALAIKGDGTVVCWGLNLNGQCNVPGSLVSAIDVAGGGFHSAAVSSGGTVVCWGLNLNGQCDVPAGLVNVRSVAARGDHTMALTASGEVVCWGRNDYGQCDVPADMGPIRQIAAGRDFSAALTLDGRVFVWGLGLYGQTTVPSDLGVVRSISTGRESVYVVLGTDLCPNDPSKISPGHCGCGANETDSDGDTMPDCVDGCPMNPGLVEPATYFADADGDSFGATSSTVSSCSATPPAGYVANGLDCNDADPQLNPNTVWYRDLDGDGFGAVASGTLTQCQQPTGHVRNALDCNDASAAINPTTFWYRDLDGDGFGNSLIFIQQCAQPSGYVLVGGDCNDLNLALNPATVWFRDLDGDGFGSSGSGTIQQCEQPAGFVLNDLDCNDSNASINPDTRWYRDQDGDGFGDPSQSILSCAQPSGFVLNSADGCPSDAAKQAPGICGCGVADVDGDGDGVANCVDNCPSASNPSQSNSDGDSSGDACDGCASDPLKTVPGQCGCGIADTDIDGDGAADCLDVAFAQTATLVAAGGASGDQFGWAGSISGDYAIVGAFNADASFSNQGKASVFRRLTATSWTLEATLVSTSPSADARFGWAVAIDGDTAVVGSYLDDSVSTDAGAAFVYRRSGGGSWALEQKLLASDASLGDQFGVAVAISGSAIVVGARGAEDAGGLNRGAAYVFRRNGAVWTQEALLKANDGADFDAFGDAVSISGGFVAVGAPADDLGSSVDAGSTYVYRLDGTAWVLDAKLVASDAATGDGAGGSLALKGQTLVLGAPFDDVGTQESRGSAYVFARSSGTSSGTWSQVTKVLAPDGSALDEFGRSVGLDGDTAVIGAWGQTVAGQVQRGSAYVFRRHADGIWRSQSKLVASDGQAGHRFGTGIAVSSGRALVGGLLANGSTGASYLFDLTRLDCDGNGVPDLDTDSDGVANCFDTDDDDDGTYDVQDGCPTDPMKTAPGACGCGISDADGDGDGTPNCIDGCPADPLKTAPGACGCNVSDVDSDSDGIPNCTDNCDFHANADQRDCDGDGAGDVCEIAAGSAADCDSNGGPDDCQIASGSAADGNGNGQLDCCEFGFNCQFAASQWPVSGGGNGHWYQYVTSPAGPGTHFPRADAAAYATSRGARLVSITSAAEQAFVAGTLGGRPSTGFTWIGLEQAPGSPEPAGGWGWIGGEPLVYVNWVPTQPDNQACNTPGLAQSFGVISWAHGGRWDDGSDPYPSCTAPTTTALVEWSADCDGNGIVDYGQIRSGLAPDANGNFVIDCCESLPGCNGTYDVPGEFPTVQAAINAIPAGVAGTVAIGPGTFAGPIELGGRNVVVRGAGMDLTTLSGAGIQASVVRLNGEPATAGLSDLTIRLGQSGSLLNPTGTPILVGGGIYGRNSSAFLTRVRLEQNNAEFGGGAYFYRCTLDLEECEFLDNVARIDGGGMLAYECNGSVAGALFDGNTCGLFGPGSGSALKVVGARTAGAEFLVEDCVMTANVATTNGSAIEWYPLNEGIPGAIRIQSSTIEFNQSGTSVPLGAAGLRSLGASAGCRLVDSVFCDNSPRNVSGSHLRLGSTVVCDCLADVAQSNLVDAIDLALLLSRWGPVEPDGLCDFDSNGLVDALDLAFLLSEWGPCP